MTRFIIILALASGLALAFCQNPQNDSVTKALGLIDKGQPEGAIPTLTSLTGSANDGVRGRAWTLLGYAYKEEGKFDQARRCYERALGVFGQAAKFDIDRAATLSYFGNLESEMGNLSDAQKLLLESIDIDQRRGDHAALSSALTHMAGVEIERKQYKAARKYLQSASNEEKLATDFNTELLADLYGTKGWLASVTGKTHDAVRNYEQTLVTCTERFGAAHPLTGWSYLLLGKAVADDGDVGKGMKSIREGLQVLETTVGTHDLRYLAGQLLYSQILDRSGQHAESARLASAARQALNNAFHNQCFECTVSVWSFQPR
jgi:Tetratricopeptide repeat